MNKLIVAFLAASLPTMVLAFAPTTSSKVSTKLHFFNKKTEEKVSPVAIPAKGSGNSMEKIFKGGLFSDDDESEIMASAIKIALKIKTTKDLGWTQAPKRKGKARPRSRAWGGEGEKPVQSKANYDESKENCVEKWLTIEDLVKYTKCQPGPAADTVFVALAGGAKYAERDVCEEKIQQWTDGAARGKINEEAFIKSVKAGRNSLIASYVSFLSVNTFFASCILFPTNPAAKGLESLVDSLKDNLGPAEILFTP